MPAGAGADDSLVQLVAAAYKGFAKKVYEDADADLQLKGPLICSYLISFV